MLDEQIVLNEDLKRLKNEGYELEIHNGCAIVHHIPYLDEHQNLCYGSLVSPLQMNGNKTTVPTDHTIYFSGSFPCDTEGKRLLPLWNSQVNRVVGGIPCQFFFSNKPDGGYKDYHHKFTTYCYLISLPAKRLYPDATATTFRPVRANEESVFCYDDMNASRAGIEGTSNKLKHLKVGIVGLGGTGSYLLDFLAKTPVAEIHLYDGDTFHNHNAFRAPGASAITDFKEHEYKVDHFAAIYRNMHRCVFPHACFLDDENVAELYNLDFVFLCIDSGVAKKLIVDALTQNQVPFIDTGISVSNNSGILNAMIRADFWSADSKSRILKYLDFSNDVRDDPYNSNIQIAELNAMAAILAIIRWKKYYGYYADLTQNAHEVYTIADGEITHENQ